MRLATPIAPQPDHPLPIEPQSTVHQRAKQRCIILRLPYPDAHLPGDGPIKLPLPQFIALQDIAFVRLLARFSYFRGLGESNFLVAGVGQGTNI